METFPVTSAMLWTLGGATVWAVLMSQWIKHYLPDWRWTNLLTLGLTLALIMPVGVFIVAQGAIGERIVQSLLMSFAGASFACYGYEFVLNGLGLAGIGQRSNKALVKEAKTTVKTPSEVGEPK
jgi:hypothetical protein